MDAPHANGSLVGSPTDLVLRGWKSQKTYLEDSERCAPKTTCLRGAVCGGDPATVRRCAAPHSLAHTASTFPRLSAHLRRGNTFASSAAVPFTLAPVTSVLIVDDEAAVRNVMARWVTSLGLNAQTAASADEALERVKARRCELERHARSGGNERDLLLAIAQARTPDTLAHAERVARYAVSVARVLAMDARHTATLEQAAVLHDIGKVAVPDSLLQKPSPLTPGEQAVMRRHVDAGAEILAATTTLIGLAPIVLASHEWFDGGGYPLKLAGESIPPAARIIPVVDAYDAMTQDRQYRSRLDSAEAVAELLRCTGSQFDPAIVTAFLAVL